MSALPESDNPAYALLTVRHVDALTAAVTALNMTMVRVERVVIKLTEAIAGQQADTRPTAAIVLVDPAGG